MLKEGEQSMEKDTKTHKDSAQMKSTSIWGDNIKTYLRVILVSM
jgi:hypothetical protein